MSNIYDVAKQAGVSVATVSAVINSSSYVSPALRDKVERAISSLHYSPNLLARSLAQRKTHTLGVLIPDIANPFFPEIVRGAEDKAKEAGYTIILGNSDNQLSKEEVYLNLFLSKRVDGILLVKAIGDMSTALFEKLRSGGPPIVLVDREYPHLQADTVVADDCGGADAAVRHLLKLGHRRIGMLAGIPGISTTIGRSLGYRQALESKKIPYDPALVVHGDYGIEAGYKAGLQLLEQNPTAVFVTNCLMTAGFMKALEKKKLHCPEDISLI
ncbi:MAG: LacI family DNA-binding transcriptional regulator, partial [Candidatus Acidiferrales bacterium]